MADNRKYITISKDLFEDYEELSSYTDEQIGKIFKAFIAGSVFGEASSVSDPLCKRVLRDLFKEDGQALQVWERNDKNGGKGGRPPKPKENPNETQPKPKENPNETQSEPKQNPIEIEIEEEREIEGEQEVGSKKEKEKENIYGAKAPTRSSFTRPTLLEVKAYCEERQNGIVPEQWYDFYEANGWKVGRNAMKDWKACIRSWERRRAEEQANKPKTREQEMHELYLKALEADRKEAELDKGGSSNSNESPFGILPF